MPLVPTYDAEETISPGKEPSVDFDTSRYAAEAAEGKAVEGSGGAVTDLGAHLQAQADRADHWNAGLQDQARRVDLQNAFDAAQQAAGPDGGGFLESFRQQAAGINQSRLASLPGSMQEHYGQRWQIENSEWEHRAAEQQLKLQKNYSVNALGDYTQQQLKVIANDPSEQNTETVLQDGMKQIENAPGLTSAERYYAGQQFQRQIQYTSLATRFRDDPDGLARELGARGLNAPQPGYVPGAGGSGGSGADAVWTRMIRKESGGDPNAVSPKGAQGVAQVMPDTARTVASSLGRMDLVRMSDSQLQSYFAAHPDVNEQIGRAYFDQQLQRYGGDVQAAAVAYNGGPKRADAWLKAGRDDSVLPAETRDYYRTVAPAGGIVAMNSPSPSRTVVARQGNAAAGAPVAYVPPIQGGAATPDRPAPPVAGDQAQPDFSGKAGNAADVPVPLSPSQQAAADQSKGKPATAAAPADIYANIPDVDDKGRPGQKAKFTGWNSDPIANDQKKFAELDPRMQAIIAQARKDNPGLNFVIGSGKRTQADEDKAVKNGWSPARYAAGGTGQSEHLSGRAADIWALDDKNAITFDRSAQDRVTAAMKAAAQKLGLPMTAGADFRNADRPHFEVAAQDVADGPHTGRPDHPDSPEPVGVPAPQPDGGGAGPSVPSKGMGPSMPVATGGAAPAGVANANLMPYLAKGKPASNITKLEPNFAGRLQTALEHAPEEVRNATVIGSGARDYNEQATIYNKALQDHGADARKWAAPPGSSNHNHGLAADLGFKTPEAQQWWHANAERFALKFPLGNEAWHIEPSETRGGGHPPVGSPGTAIVVNRDGQNISQGGSPNPRYSSLTYDDTQRLLSFAAANQQRAQQQQQAATKADSYNTTRLVQDDISSIKSTGTGVPDLDSNRVATVLGPAAAQQYEEQKSQAYATYRATSGMSSMSDDELRAHAEQYHPGPQDAGAGFTQRSELYKDVHDQAEAIIKQRATDPAAAVAEAPNVVKAMRSLSSGAPTLQGNESLIAERYAAQSALGIAKSLQSPIPADEAKVYASKMRPLSSGQAEATDQEGVVSAIVDDVQARYGKFAPDVLKQIISINTMKAESADLVVEAMQRMAKTQSGPLTTTATGAKAATAQRADAMAVQSGAATPSQPSATRRSFLEAQDTLMKDPSLLPLFIQRYGVDRVPSALRQQAAGAR